MAEVVLSRDLMKRCADRHKRFVSGGFTLVELLVVVAIIGILVAILIPTLSRARELAKTATCANNMKEIGRAFQIFANQNGGRAPGPCFYGTGSMTWPEILDAEVFGRAEGSYSITRFGAAANQKILICPNYVVQPLKYNRGYAVNANLGAQGPADNPANHIAMYNSNGVAISYASLSVNYYNYGQPLAKFGPEQILLAEHDWSDDDVGGDNAALIFNRDVTTNPDPTAPGYDSWNGVTKDSSGNITRITTGVYTFRHPYYEKANFLSFDGHLETQGTGGDGRSTKRYSPL